MTLKKSDKLIAVIGVVILIIAGIGIIFYAGIDKENKAPTVNEEKVLKTFEVNYIEVSLPIDPDNIDYTIKPKLIGQAKWTGNIVLDMQNLKSIDIMVEYHDNFCGFFFGKILRPIGADAFTITIYKDNEEVAKDKITDGDGIVEFPSITIGSIIPILTIDAKDIEEAKAKLQEQYINYTLNYTIQITLKTGLWKKFSELLSKDTFDLKVNYTQFVYDIKNPESDSGDNNPPTGNYEEGTQTWAVMSYPGKN